MATSRPFAYNPIPPGSEISGTTQFVNLAIGVLNEQYDEDYGGVKWWEGPDEDLGYVICQPVSGNTQPTPITGVFASVGFYRTTAFTDSAFLYVCNKLPARKNQPKFQTTNEALVWLTANGYWTNYSSSTPTPTPTITVTPTITPTITVTPTSSITTTNTPTPTYTPTLTPSYPNAMILTFRIANNGDTLTLPYGVSSTPTGTIYWGDGSSSANTYANRTHTYTTAGNYNVTIDGTSNGFNFGSYGDVTNRGQLIDIKQWGIFITTGDWVNLFRNCINLSGISATDIPNFTPATDLTQMFRGCSKLGTTTTNIGSWNVSNVIQMTEMFYGNTVFNQNIGSWNVSGVTRTDSMFLNATSFNQNIGNWNVSNVTNMNAMFYGATAFNQNIGNWNVSNVTDISQMFNGASAFNQNIGNWNMSNVTTIYAMFRGATAFNQNIGNWNVSGVTNMEQTFYQASAFNQNIGSWDVRNVVRFNATFYFATSFNQNISSWNVSGANLMGSMFLGASAFNQNISNWDVSHVTDMASMFRNATAFNQDLSPWCVTLIPTQPTNFSLGASSWVLAKPIWGTCPLTPTPTPSFTPTPTLTQTPTLTNTPTTTETPTQTPTASETPPSTPDSTPASTPDSTPASTPDSTPASTPDSTPASTPTSTLVSSAYFNVYDVDVNCNLTFRENGISFTSHSDGFYDFDGFLLYLENIAGPVSGGDFTTATSSSCTPPPSGANITLFAKTSSISGGPYYMWYSIDSGSTFTQFSTALTTTCTNVGTTVSQPVGTTFLFFMSDSNDPASSGGWPTRATSTGGTCPATTTLCTLGAITTTTSGTLTVWATGNQALPNAC